MNCARFRFIRISKFRQGDDEVSVLRVDDTQVKFASIEDSTAIRRRRSVRHVVRVSRLLSGCNFANYGS